MNKHISTQSPDLANARLVSFNVRLKTMTETIFISSTDLEVGYTYSIHISVETAQEILSLDCDEQVRFNNDKGFARMHGSYIQFFSGKKGGISSLDKTDVMRQINEQLEELNDI